MLGEHPRIESHRQPVGDRCEIDDPGLGHMECGYAHRTRLDRVDLLGGEQTQAFEPVAGSSPLQLQEGVRLR